MSENKEIQAAFEKWVKSCNGDIKLVELTNPSLIKAFMAGYKARHNEAPTGKTQELIKRISGCEVINRGGKFVQVAPSLVGEIAAQLTAQADEIKKADNLKVKFIKQEYEISQILGKALNYPWYKDDKKIFPDAIEDDGVCTGEHIAITLAVEAADEIKRLREGLKKISNMNDDATIRETAKQLLNNEGV